MSLQRWIPLLATIYVCCFVASVKGGRWNFGRMLEVVSAETKQLLQVVEDMKEGLRKMDEDIATMKQDIRDDEMALRKQKHKVAFHASTNVTRVYRPHEIIQFPDLHVNVANDYNNKTGKFTCDNLDLYVFTATILGGQDPVWFDIVLDGRTLAAGYTGKGNQASGTQTAVVHCNPGNQVWVRAHDHGAKGQRQAEVMQTYSEFVGYRIG